MKAWKIILGISILFLLIGSAAATDYNLKAPTGIDDISTGVGKYADDKDVYMYIGKLSDNEGVFENNTDEGFGVSKLNDNIYVYIDSLLKESGVQEVVDINGEQTVVSVSNSQWISDPSNPEDLSEMETYHSMLKEFNKLNNLEPVEV